MGERIDWMAELLSIIIQSPSRNLRKINLVLHEHDTSGYSEALNELANLSQNTETFRFKEDSLRKEHSDSSAW